MATVDDFYDLIEAGDPKSVEKLLVDEPLLVEGGGATPPPIHWAIYHDRLAVVEVLLQNGVDIERQDQDRDSTPLEYSVVFGRRKIAELLIRSGASTEGVHGLALRGMAGEFEQYPDVASLERFEEMAALLAEA